jgi:hypothetical protein
MIPVVLKVSYNDGVKTLIGLFNEYVDIVLAYKYIRSAYNRPISGKGLE